MTDHMDISPARLRFLAAVPLLFLLPAAGAAQEGGLPFLHAAPERAFAEFKLYGPDGDPLRVPVEDWEGARRRVATDAEWASWLARTRADVDDWMARRHDRVEWVAGWWHDFVSPRDGSRLVFTPDEPGEETLHSPSDPRVKLTPELHAAWVYNFRTLHNEKMLEAARLFRLTGDERYARWAAGQLDFYADNFQQWPLRTRGGNQSRLFWQSLDEAVNLVRHVHVVRLLGDHATPERRQQWLERLFRPQVEMLQAGFQSIHNIAGWHRSAAAHVALLYEDPALWRAALDTPFGLRNQIARGVTGDYLWHEQSLGYNSYVVRSLLPLFEMAALRGRAGELRREMLIVQNLMLSPLALRFPGGQLPTPADGSRLRAPDAALLASARRIFPTTLGVAAAAGERSWQTLLDPPSAAAREPSLPAARSQSLESSRMALLKAGRWQVFFHYGQLLASHAQAEALNYEAYYDGTDITHDAGTVGYGSPLHREFYRTAAAHNVPLIDGEGQQSWKRGQLLRFDSVAGVVSAAQPEYRSDAAARRTLRVEGERLIDEVEVETRRPRGQEPRLGMVVNLQGSVRLPAAFAPDAGFAEGRPAGFGYWKNPRSATYRDRATFDVVFSGRPMRVTIATEGPFRVTHASTPDAPPARRESLYVEVLGKPRARFTTVFEPVAGAAAAR